MTTETLAQRIRRIRRDSSLADPHELARKVLADLQPEDYHAALAEALPEYVRVTAGRDRMVAASSVPRIGVSKKARAGDWWQKQLDTVLDVSADGSGQWKRLAECVRADLLNAAAQRRAIAAKAIWVANTYELLADQLPDDDATVACLDPEVARGVFGRAA